MKLQVELNNPNGLVRVRILGMDCRICADSQPIGPFEAVGFNESDALYRLYTLLKKAEEALRQVFNIGSPIDGVNLTAPLRDAMKMVGFRRGMIALQEREPLTHVALVAEGTQRANDLNREKTVLK